jgi:hypothetical protein
LMNWLQIAGFYVVRVARVGDKGRTGSHGADSSTDPLSTKRGGRSGRRTGGKTPAVSLQ